MINLMELLVKKINQCLFETDRILLDVKSNRKCFDLTFIRLLGMNIC